MKYSADFIQKLRDSVNITEVVGEHVVLRKSGSNFSGLCPFHSERTPSFSVSEVKQLYHCYGCKAGGDLFDFVKNIYGIDFPEAVEELAERARLPLPKDAHDKAADPETQKRREQAREKLALAHKLNRFVAAFYRQQLQEIAEAAGYFRSRGIEPAGDLGRAFYLGAAPSSWDALTRHLIEKKAPLSLAQELGLIRPSAKKTASSVGYFDLFRNRVTFPILDMRGKVVGFGGRNLPGAQPGEGESAEGPKYLNSSESALFQKGRLAFGLYQAQKHIREKDEVILVEGYFDVLALHAAGFENVVATCGTSLTVDHLHLFKKFCSRVTVLFDGDSAGVSATERAMETALDQGAVIYGAKMPEGLDPDEILFDPDTGQSRSEGRERMAALLREAGPLLDQRMREMIAEGRKGPEAQAQSLKKIAGWLNRFQDPLGRQVRIESLKKEMGVSPQLLAQALGSLSAGVGNRQGTSQESRPVAARNQPQARSVKFNSGMQKITQCEKILLMALALGGEHLLPITQRRDKMPPEQGIESLFDFPPARQWVQGLLSQPGALETFRDSPDLSELDPQLQMIFREAWLAPSPLISPAEVTDAAERAVSHAWARFSQYIKTALTQAEANKDAELQQRLMKEYLDVQRKMKDFTSLYDEA